MTDKKAVSWLLTITGKKKRYIILLLLLQVVVNGGAVFYAMAMKQMVDSAMERNKDGFFVGLLAFGLLMLVLILLRGVLRQIEEFVRSSMENQFKERLFGQLLVRDYSQVSAVHSEEWMNRMTSDTVICANGMTELLPGFVGMSVRMVVALVMIFLLQPKLAYILIPGGLIFVVITFVLRKWLKTFHKKVQEKDGKVRVFLQERISGMLILRTFGVEKKALEGATREFNTYKKARMQKALISNFSSTGFTFAINGMYFIGIGYCGYGILNGVVSYGTLTAMIQLIGQLQTPLAGISGFVPRFYAMIASAERLMEIEDYKKVKIDGLKTPEEAKKLYNESIDEIVFDKVSFDYIKEQEKCPVLEEVSLSVKKGDYVAVIGGSGCGKSTLLKLIMGIYEPQSGMIEVIQKDGKRIPITMLRRLFAYVPQGHYLMNQTIREVITFCGNNDSEITAYGTDDMTIKKAIALACADFVWELPEGLDTLLGEKGSGLSEGQMQRIAIARALYANAPVLILDEATSALDGETEKALLHNLKQLTDKTVLIVTHRPEALNICNRRFSFDEDGSLIKS